MAVPLQLFVEEREPHVGFTMGLYRNAMSSVPHAWLAFIEEPLIYPGTADLLHLMLLVRINVLPGKRAGSITQ